MMIILVMRKIWICFFKGLSRNQIAKVNELTKVINEKDVLQEKQEDLLIDETMKMRNLKRP